MIYKNVTLGKGCRISETCIIGMQARGKSKKDKVVLGDNCIVQPFSCIFAGSKIGDGFFLGLSSLVRENNHIGDNVSIGSNCTIGPRNTIKNGARIHSGCFLEDCIIEEDVFIAPNVVFTNDRYPPLEDKKKLKGARVRRGASIGANSTVLPGIIIGEYSLVGAGSVVTKDVPAQSVVAGNPARVIRDRYGINKLRLASKKR